MAQMINELINKKYHGTFDIGAKMKCYKVKFAKRTLLATIDLENLTKIVFVLHKNVKN